MVKNKIDLEEFVNLAGKVFQRYLKVMGINEKINIIAPGVSLNRRVIGNILALGLDQKTTSGEPGDKIITTTTPPHIREKIGMSLIEYVIKEHPTLQEGNSTTYMVVNKRNLEILKSLLELSDEEYILWLKLA